MKEKFLRVLLASSKEKFLGVLLGVFLVLGLAIMVPVQGFAQGFYVGGGSDQYQYMMNDGAITDTTLWQYQVQMQQTVFGVEDMAVAEVDSFMSGYMEQEIGNCCSTAYTSTGNSTYYGVSVDTGVSAGAGADAYAFSATSGDAFGYADAYTDVSITILP